MAPRIVRGQLALDTGDRLRELGGRVLKLHEYSGEALDQQLRTISTGLAAQLGQLETLVKSCRAGKNSYPNYPALRAAIGDAGDLVYEIQAEVGEVQSALNMEGDWTKLGNDLLLLATRLRMVQFVPPESTKATSNS
jgi:hypothetical protein